MKHVREHSVLRDAVKTACAVTGAVLAASGAPLSEREALDRLSMWMNGHPVMGCAAGRAVASSVTFPADANPYSMYVVTFSPAGYAVLNSDDRLPLTVAFSASSGVSLAERPDNIFRAALLAHAEQTAQTLSAMDDTAAPDLTYLRAGGRAPLSIEQFGPYLATVWNQCHPYNLDCPEDPEGSEYYGYRVPTGCTPTAYAQVMAYHRWPLRGHGAHSYIDTSGSITGAHSVTFNTPFGWAAMQTAYDPWSASQTGDVEVADLMYRLGVAADADYESGGTSSSLQTLGSRINTHLYFEPPVYAGTQAALLPALDDDLRAGYPAVVAIPGHAIVADGLLNDNGTVSYHINYGWGGDNNGWWSANGVPGGAIAYGCTAIRPMLMAFPAAQTAQAAAGEPATLEWLLPVRREQEASRLLLQRLTPQIGGWSSGAETLDHTEANGWQLSASGRSGSCWFAGPNGYKALTLTDVFVPDASAALTFWLQYRLGTATFRVAVSSDGGESYTSLFERNNNYPLNWQSHSVGLGAYAGQQIRIRFELTSGSYYTDSGGVWLDDLSVASSTWSRWLPLAEDATLASRRFSEQRTVFDACADFSVFEVTSTSTYKDWVVSTTSGVDHCFYKQPDGYSNHKYHLTAYAPVTPSTGTRLLMRWKRSLASDRFRVLVSLNRSTFTEIWSAGGASDWTEQVIPLGAYAGQPIYLRLEYTVGSYYADGGVWIDTLWLQEVAYPELEGQPVHYTVLTNLLEVGSYTLATVVEDTGSATHARSPSFTLNVVARFNHRTDPGGTVTLTGYNGSAERLEIPSLWAGLPVAGLASNAFADTPVVSVLLPATLTAIEADAFTGADALQRLFFAGDAPSAAADALAGSTATVYYLPGTSGWSASFGGRQALLWNPAAADDAAFGFLDGIFGFTLTGTALIPVRVQATTNLRSAVWSSVTNTAIGAAGTVDVRDPESTAHAARFYRFVWP